MAHSPYEPGQGFGRGVDPDPTVGGVYGETYTQPVDDLYAPVTGSETSTSAGDVKDTAKDQGRRVADTAKESAGQVKDTAVEQGQQVASVAKDQAGQVAQQAAGQLRNLVGQSRDELGNQVGSSQNRLAEYVHSLSDELGTMASGGSDGTGPLADLAHRYSRRGGEISSWLSDHEPADVLNEVTRFARRRPFAFLGASLLAGVVVGRVTRSLAAEAKDEHDEQQQPARAAIGGPTYATSSTDLGHDQSGVGYGQGAGTGVYDQNTAAGYGSTPGYVTGDLPESPAPQTWSGGSR